MRNILFFISLDRNCFNTQLEGIYRYSRKRNWHVQVVEKSLRRNELRKTLDFWKPSGVLVEYGEARNVDFSAFGDIPVVCIDIGRRLPHPRMNVVGLDSAAVGTLGADYFYSLGFEHFGYVGYWESMLWDRERRDAFVSAVREQGLDCSVFTPRRKTSAAERHQALRVYLKNLPRPCGIMACNDRTGEDVLIACSLLGIRVPEEVSVLGVDNDLTLCENIVPSLTSIDPDTSRSGFVAAEMLDRLMSGEDSHFPLRCFYPPSRVVVRRSTRRLSCDSSTVGAAVELIRTRACEGISVKDVVESMGISRRAAENHFRQATGRTIYEEINEARFAKVFELLRDPKRSISTIAGFCGFSTEVALRKAFRLRTGLSMSRWRKKEM